VNGWKMQSANLDSLVMKSMTEFRLEIYRIWNVLFHESCKYMC